MRVVVTGADGFLGWHTRVRLRATTNHDVVAVSRSDWSDLARLVTKADAVIHVAGINRGSDQLVRHGNIELAEQLRGAILASEARPQLVYANSVRSGEPGSYGDGKSGASAVLADLAAEIATAYVDTRLPNLFGEHGRPRYNSFVANFVEAVTDGDQPTVDDRPIELLHAQAAAQALIDGLHGPSTVRIPSATPTSVGEVYRRLRHFRSIYAAGDIPSLTTDLDLDLFNTLRAGLFPGHYPIAVTSRSDQRGDLVEVVRAHGGQGQTFVSTTRPGKTRGDHFHLRKVERFVVIRGMAQISLRRVCSEEVVTFSVSGDQPVIVDMPTLWAHKITNTGPEELTTLFWASELFDPAQPDTVPELVTPILTPVGEVA